MSENSALLNAAGACFFFSLNAAARSVKHEARHFLGTFMRGASLMR